MRVALPWLMSSNVYPTSSPGTLGVCSATEPLLCRKCGNHVGNAYVRKSPYPLVFDESDSAPATATTDISTCRKYDIRLRALQPSSSEPSAIPLLT